MRTMKQQLIERRSELASDLEKLVRQWLPILHEAARSDADKSDEWQAAASVMVAELQFAAARLTPTPWGNEFVL